MLVSTGPASSTRSKPAMALKDEIKAYDAAAVVLPRRKNGKLKNLSTLAKYRRRRNAANKVASASRARNR